jgi:hypothetical protein
VAEQDDDKTVAELATMSYDERYAYFLARPMPGAPDEFADLLARSRAKAVLTIAKRDIEQLAKRERRQAS